METPLQKFNGENFYNNAITVDFEKRNVEFVPIVKGRLFSYYFDFLISLVYATIIPFVAGCFTIRLLEIFSKTNTHATIIFTCGWLVVMFITSLIYFNKNWRNKNSAKFMFETAFFLKHKRTVTPDMINNKSFMFPFKNVGLEYRLYGDFTKIRKIYIKNPFPNDMYTWLCCFEFKKQPKIGEMKLVYV